MLGVLYVGSGNEGSRVLDNYNLLFAILIHFSMATMMLTVLTCKFSFDFNIKETHLEFNWNNFQLAVPTEMGILLKEHFNRWYSLKAYYLSVSLLDLPITVVGCFLFSVIIYLMTSQPLEVFRFSMFFVISVLVTIVGQSIGLMVGAWFDVVVSSIITKWQQRDAQAQKRTELNLNFSLTRQNGTFLAPTIAIPMMMFAGFGVTLRDLPSYMKWGSHISYLRYGLEGYVGAIYGEGRTVLKCDDAIYCHYR